jgi:hypothetical protein
LGKSRRHRAREPSQRCRVEIDELRELIGSLIDESSRDAHAGIVHQDADTGVVAKAIFDSRQLTRLGEIRSKDVHCNTGLAVKLSGKSLHTSAVARHEHQIVAALGETFGVDRADPVEAPVIRTEGKMSFACSFATVWFMHYKRHAQIAEGKGLLQKRVTKFSAK